MNKEPKPLSDLVLLHFDMITMICKIDFQLAFSNLCSNNVKVCKFCSCIQACLFCIEALSLIFHNLVGMALLFPSNSCFVCHCWLTKPSLWVGLAGKPLTKDHFGPQGKEASILSAEFEKVESTLSITVVGASGDLAKKKIFPALFALFYEDCLPEVPFFVASLISLLTCMISINMSDE